VDSPTPLIFNLVNSSRAVEANFSTVSIPDAQKLSKEKPSDIKPLLKKEDTTPKPEKPKKPGPTSISIKLIVTYKIYI